MRMDVSWASALGLAVVSSKGFLYYCRGRQALSIAIDQRARSPLRHARQDRGSTADREDRHQGPARPFPSISGGTSPLQVCFCFAAVFRKAHLRLRRYPRQVSERVGSEGHGARGVDLRCSLREQRCAFAHLSHARWQGAASPPLVSRSRAMPAGGRRSKPSPRSFSFGSTRFGGPAGRAASCRTAPPHLASGSGLSWNLRTLLGVPLPPSMWKGARVLTVAHRPLPFQPPFGSSMRPSIHLV